MRSILRSEYYRTRPRAALLGFLAPWAAAAGELTITDVQPTQSPALDPGQSTTVSFSVQNNTQQTPTG